ncbi:MAG: sulfatase [Candidatus Latescibacteria bacterium]|nr:sulfatase [Candidatus Latescibacterota bacterium]
MSNQSKGFFIVCIGLLATISIHTGCGELRQKPNVVVLLVDTLRADHLKCYGYHRDTAPFLEGLARRGAVFTQCYAPSDYTPASTASLFTGQYPLAHGYLNSHYVLAESHTTMAEIFQRQGYITAGFIANGLAGEKYQMHQGFDHYFEKNRASAAELVAAASAFIEQQTDEPFFAYLHFLDVHDPHRIPQEYHGRFADPANFAYDMQDTLQLDSFVMQAWWEAAQGWRDQTVEPEQIAAYFADYVQLYDASISYWDEHLGTLLDLLAAQGIDERTIIVVTSDHGEQFLEHGYFGHGNSGYQVGLHIPFIISDPLHPNIAGLRVDNLVNAVDILPTLLARLNWQIAPAVQGQERWSLLASDAPSAASESIYTEGTFMANRPFSTLIQTYREGEWKLLLDRLRDTKELYHLKEDPGELRDRFAEQPEIAAQLYGKIRQYYNGNLQLAVDRAKIAGVASLGLHYRASRVAKAGEGVFPHAAGPLGKIRPLWRRGGPGQVFPCDRFLSRPSHLGSSHWRVQRQGGPAGFGRGLV